MRAEDAEALLHTSHFGILAMGRDGDAYAVPLYFAYDGEHVWFHCHPGLKDKYLDHAKEVCLVVTHVGSPNVWESVQVFGKAEKATLSNDLDAAKAALARVPLPPAHGNYPKGLPIRTGEEIYHVKLTPSHIEGMQSAFKSE